MAFFDLLRYLFFFFVINEHHSVLVQLITSFLIAQLSSNVWHLGLNMMGTFIPFLQASIAKLETSVSFFSDKMELKVYGFNDKLPVLLSKVLAVAKSFWPTEDRFMVHISVALCFFSAVCLILVWFYVWFEFLLVCLICEQLNWTLTGYQRRYEKNFKKHQHEASKSFIILKIASAVQEFL